MVEIRKADRRKAKLRVGASGPSGSGKTYSALLIAKGMASSWDKVLLIDTENGSGELYSDLGDYNLINLVAPFAPERYIEALHAAEDAGMEVIVIDSTSHEWDGKGGCLELNEKIAQAKFRGNTWSAWSETTPRHQRFLEAITSSPCHIITTARSKTDTIQTEDKKIKKVGLKEIQREGFEYELTVNFNIDREGHLAIASKDRTRLFIDRDPFLITEETGKELLKWGEQGKEAPKADPHAAQKRSIFSLVKALGGDVATAESINTSVKKLTKLTLAPENYEEIITRLKVAFDEQRDEVTDADVDAALGKNTMTPTTPDVTGETFRKLPGTVSQAEADDLVAGYKDEDPKRAFTREELDGSIWLVMPEYETKQLIAAKLSTKEVTPKE